MLNLRRAPVPHALALAALLGGPLPAFAADADPAAPRAPVTVPAGTPVVVMTTAELRSNTVHAKDAAEYVLVSDVIVDGHVVARAGDSATGIVKDARAGSATATRVGRGLGRLVGGLAGVSAIGGAIGGAAGSSLDKYANLRLTVDTVKSFCGDTLRVDFDRSEYHPTEKDATTPVKVVKGQRYVATVSAAQTVCGVSTTAAPAAIPDDALRSSAAVPAYAAPAAAASPSPAPSPAARL
jgi:hypothetical protein